MLCVSVGTAQPSLEQTQPSGGEKESTLRVSVWSFASENTSVTAEVKQRIGISTKLSIVDPDQL